jgi:hypothetical protein
MKRGQFWYNDFAIAFSILAIIGVFFTIAMMDVTTREKGNQDLFSEAISIGNSLTGTGYSPEEWEEVKGGIGVVDNSRVNLTKLYYFYTNSLTTNDYRTKIKVLLGIKYDFVFYFEDKFGNRITDFDYDFEEGYFGDPSFVGVENLDSKNIIKFTRFVFLNSDLDDEKGNIVKLVVVSWD